MDRPNIAPGTLSTDPPEFHGVHQPPFDGGTEAVIAANREFFRKIASKYDNYEACAGTGYFQSMLEMDLDTIERHLPRSNEPIECLDCGGGTGNLTIKMLRRGWHVTAVDVSSEMIDLSRTKTTEWKSNVCFVHDSVENFLTSCHQTFHVISFSSVLHHLYSPAEVVRQAGDRISDDGFFYSNFDPVIPSSAIATSLLAGFDTVFAKLAHDRKDFFPGVSRRFQKLFSKDKSFDRNIASPGDLAEFHARTGLDDRNISDTLAQLGFSVDTRKYPSGRTAPIRWLNRYIPALINFRILAHKTHASRSDG